MVAFPMSRRVSVVVLGIVCLLLPACAKSKLTKANFEAIRNGMSRAEVENLIGPPTEEVGGEANLPSVNAAGLDLSGPPVVGGGKTLKWESGKRMITVNFDKAGKVSSKIADGLPN